MYTRSIFKGKKKTIKSRQVRLVPTPQSAATTMHIKVTLCHYGWGLYRCPTQIEVFLYHDINCKII